MKTRLVLPLLLLGVIGRTIGLAQTPGSFQATGAMITPRTGHSATLLSDGRVLIAGGVTGSYKALISTEARAEVYDPATQGFTATGSMTTPRQSHTATLLPNGKVLIAGGGIVGIPPTFALSSAEIYDSTTGTFLPTGNMTTARALHTATLLNDGRVLIAGGHNLSSAEIYDPTTGTFTAVSQMTFLSTSWPFVADAATLLPSGKVLIIHSNYSVDSGHAELYDPSATVFSPTGDTIPRY